MNFKAPVVVSCSDVCVEYKLSSIKTNTLKELLINKVKRKHSVQIRKALRGVSITARKGDCIALIGHNGCGKSTLLKCLSGIISPRSGEDSYRWPSRSPD